MLSPRLFKCPVLGTQLTFSISWWQKTNKQKNREQTSAVHTRARLAHDWSWTKGSPVAKEPSTQGHCGAQRPLAQNTYNCAADVTPGSGGPRGHRGCPLVAGPRANLQGCGWSPALSAPSTRLVISVPSHLRGSGPVCPLQSRLPGGGGSSSPSPYVHFQAPLLSIPPAHHTPLPPPHKPGRLSI